MYLTTGVNNLELFKLQGGFKDYNERSRRDVRRVGVASLMTSPDDGERAHCVRRLPSAATQHSISSHKSSARDGLALGGARGGVRARAVEHLEQVAGLGAHARVHVHLGALDVVVQVVAEHVQQVDGVVARRRARVPREQHKCDVADVVTHSGVSVDQF